MILIWVLMCTLSSAEGAARVAGRDSEQAVHDGRRRNQQLPLPHGEAVVLAEVAREIADLEAEVAFLQRAVSSPVFGELARIKLAEALVDNDAERAAELVLPTLEKAGTKQLQEAAVKLARTSVLSGISNALQESLGRTAKRLPRSSRRAIQAVLADPESPEGRQALLRLLDRDQGDLAALDAARRMQVLDDLTSREQWMVARCLYRHALYKEAGPILEKLMAVAPPTPEVPSSDIAFIRGRCAFRLDQWIEAEKWYLRTLATAPSRTRRAEIEVHISRTRELAGDLEGAIEMARQAVVTEKSDDRRLLLVRLRLRQGRRDLAEVGISNIRSAAAKARGRLLVALDDLAAGRTEQALAALRRVRARPWRGPARVVAAAELMRLGRAAEAINLLENAAIELHGYWGQQARRLMAALPRELVDSWRAGQKTTIQSGATNADLTLKRWAILEFEPEVMADLQTRFATIRSFPLLDSAPHVGGLAGELRSLGLDQESVRWDSGAYPVDTPEEGLWTAHQFLTGASPWLAIRTSDAVWRRWGTDIPVRAYPKALTEALYPMPRFDLVMTAARAAKIDWGIVAGVAREESRWNPEVLSKVGARGLMQLMPLTAASVAARQGMSKPTPEQLFLPDLSLTLGASELGRLNREFGGFSAAAVAAYNAGEAQSRLWLDQCGAGCSEARFVLTITFEATRGYTADVLASAEIYRGLDLADNGP